MCQSAKSKRFLLLQKKRNISCRREKAGNDLNNVFSSYASSIVYSKIWNDKLFPSLRKKQNKSSFNLIKSKTKQEVEINTEYDTVVQGAIKGKGVQKY